ncbi:hypothetical protein GPECTOR_35g933 [Gonium pectorale]|uniref:Uncharacterized protein n=1 Tax=Gonium pectorale TaxID=33097 RepID=A0A150GD36_GONPE|nr:hypothetical protein GPECTOR_35g933 [Gonium pectorale]|eukprot:KXZ47495.1 hypothetical protein GPECTOR_35g933 [Gonium pectorale]
MCGPACLPLLCLLAASLRLSPDELRGEGAKAKLCCAIAHDSVDSVRNFLLPPQPGTGLMLALVRGGTLHAAGRQLAALAGSREAVAATAAASAMAAAGATSPFKYVATLLNLVYDLISTACRVCLALPAPEALQLWEELLAALAGSEALEHAGRALLLLLLPPYADGANPAAELLEEAAFAANAAHVRAVYL